jgi:hypothetical protein
MRVKPARRLYNAGLVRLRAASSTAELALDAHPSRHPPDARVDPVECAGHRGRHLGQAVVPCDVRQFVQEDRAAPIAGPRVGNRRNQDVGPADPDRHRHRLCSTSKQSNRPPDVHRCSALGQQGHPRGITHLGRAERDTANRSMLHGKTAKQHEHAKHVKHRYCRGPENCRPR